MYQKPPNRAPKIIFLNRSFPPDSSATSLLLGDLAIHLSARGKTVHVIAGTETEDGEGAVTTGAGAYSVSLHRVAVRRAKSAGGSRHGLETDSFHAAASTILKRLVSRGDTIVAMTDPPLLCALAAQVARRRQARLVNWQQDIYPEVMVAAGVKIKGSQALSRLRDGALEAAAANVAISEGIAATLASHGARPETLRVIANWTNDGAAKPLAAAGNPIRYDWGLERRFIVAYCGTLGRGHEIETVLVAATILRNRPNICFLFVGGGHYRPALEQAAAARRLTNFVFKPYQAPPIFAQALSVANVHWISQRPEMEGLIFPSKFYGIAAAGRPIIAVTARDGEIAQLVRRHECGIVVPVGDGHALAGSIVALAADAARREEMGRKARAMLEKHFSRAAALRKWDDLLDVVGP